MLNIRLANWWSSFVWEIAIQLAFAGDVFDGIFLCCPFPTDVLNEISDLIKSIFECFPTYFCFIFK